MRTTDSGIQTLPYGNLSGLLYTDPIKISHDIFKAPIENDLQRFNIDMQEQVFGKGYIADILDLLSPEVIKLFPCSTQLSMKFFPLINVKMPTIVGILTFMSRKNSILGLYDPEKCWTSRCFYTYEHLKFHALLS